MSFFTDPFAEEVYETKYAGKFSDNISGMHSFLTQTFSEGSIHLEEFIYKILAEKKICPGGRILAFAGRSDVNGLSLMNCTTHSVEGDSLEEIADTVLTIMRASSRDQGIGDQPIRHSPQGCSCSERSQDLHRLTVFYGIIQPGWWSDRTRGPQSSDPVCSGYRAPQRIRCKECKDCEYELCNSYKAFLR